MFEAEQPKQLKTGEALEPGMVRGGNKARQRLQHGNDRKGGGQAESATDEALEFVSVFDGALPSVMLSHLQVVTTTHC